MQRALSSGVAGMLTNQLTLDVTSNNLANVNTPGFKRSRVNFVTSLVQTTFAGSAAGANVGGQNPRQIGLGVEAGSVEVDMSQGPLQSTGRNLDVAIQGEGFFELYDGTRTFYSRVGNFGLDEENNLVHLSTGYRLIGNRYNLEVNPDGTQTIAETNLPLEISVEDAFPPRATSEINYQGNLSSATPALRGQNLQSIFQVSDRVTGGAATEETLLRDLNLFTGSQIPPTDPAEQVKTMYLFGTQPDGSAWAATFDIHPWAVPSSGDNRGTVAELMENLNAALSQGSTRFGNARLENGNILVSGLGDGDGFSIFVGEGDTDYTVNETEVTAGVPVATTAENLTFAAGGGVGTPQTQVLAAANAGDGLFRVPGGVTFSGGTANQSYTVRVLANGATTPGNTFTFIATGAPQTFDIRSFNTIAGQDVAIEVTPNTDDTAAVDLDFSWEVGDSYDYNLVSTAGADNPINGTTVLDPGPVQGERAFDNAFVPPITATSGGPISVNANDVTGTIDAGLPAIIDIPQNAAGLFDMPDGFEFTGELGQAYTLTVSHVTSAGAVVQNTYSLNGLGAPQQLRLNSLFHVDAGDTVRLSIAGTNGTDFTFSGSQLLLDDTGTTGPDLTHTMNFGFNRPARLSGTVPNGTSGLLDPHFQIPISADAQDTTVTLSDPLSVAIRVNGIERGSLIIPAGTYENQLIKDRTFRLSSFPHVEPGDIVEYEIVGNIEGQIEVVTNLVDDDLTTNMTNDGGSAADGVPNMFQEGGGIDAHAWQYRNETNETFNWYRMRFVPEFVSTAIEVFDAQGGRHNLEARFFRIGTRTEAGTGAKINSWDVMIDVDQEEGAIVDDIIAGIEFDQQGRFNGINATVYGTALSDASYVGNPSSQSIRVDWLSTGPTQPSTIQLDFGNVRTHNGVTGFGSDSSAAAVGQDGYPDGKLDSLSIQPEGDIIALYTNGISRRLAQIQVTTFRNPEGLVGVEGNLWQRSTSSGEPVRRVPGNNAGFLTASALEGGNVDIATEFTRLITAQRGFQVSARVIQTTDQVLEELANLTR